MDYIDVHHIGVFGFGGRQRGEHVVRGFCGLVISLGNLLCSFPLCLKMDGLGIPFFYLFGYHINGHDTFH